LDAPPSLSKLFETTRIRRSLAASVLARYGGTGTMLLWRLPASSPQILFPE
jgi:hypothetical protein